MASSTPQFQMHWELKCEWWWSFTGLFSPKFIEFNTLMGLWTRSLDLSVRHWKLACIHVKSIFWICRQDRDLIAHIAWEWAGIHCLPSPFPASLSVLFRRKYPRVNTPSPCPPHLECYCKHTISFTKSKERTYHPYYRIRIVNLLIKRNVNIGV